MRKFPLPLLHPRNAQASGLGTSNAGCNPLANRTSACCIHLEMVCKVACCMDSCLQPYPAQNHSQLIDCDEEFRLSVHKGVPRDDGFRRHLEELLLRHFGHASFRGSQLAAIEAVLAGKDCFCLMPTGGGKSICYELPALVKPGLVLVVSPLIEMSGIVPDRGLNTDLTFLWAWCNVVALPGTCRCAALMENQVAGLKAQNISAEYLSSTQNAAVKARIFDELDSGKPSLRLLYVTPELIDTGGFAGKLKKLHGRGLLTLIAIDEAHCISSWGHDFRPSYRKLSSLRTYLPGIPILALTATAAKKVQDDVVKSLSLHQPCVLISSFNRPNIYYEVRYKDIMKSSYKDLLHLLSAAPDDCAIVYCHSRDTCNDIGARLSKDGLSCRVYHAGLGDHVRSGALEEWASGKVPIVVATVAFGMGIDRKDVRLVCHFNMPKTLEGFYQESGRGGRDGKPSKSVVYYGLEDRRLMGFLASKSNSKHGEKPKPGVAALKKNAVEGVLQVVRYCEDGSCRRKLVLAHFGEQIAESVCNRTCDACKFPHLISAELVHLKEAEKMNRQAQSGSFIVASAAYVGKDGFNATKSEFWSRDDDDNDAHSDDEISASDDEATNEAAAAVRKKQKRSSGSQVESKMEALMRAEEAFTARQGTCQLNKNGPKDKNVVPHTVRDTVLRRLTTSVEQGLQRLCDGSIEAKTAAISLETECFRKYGKSGRPFYNSQVASTVRWLSSCTLEDLLSRTNLRSPVGSKPGSESSEMAYSGREIKSELIHTDTSLRAPDCDKADASCSSLPERADDSCKGSVQRDLVEPSAVVQRKLLPAIPSFTDFLSKKRSAGDSPPSQGLSRPRKVFKPPLLRRPEKGAR